MPQTVFAPWDDPNEKPLISFQRVTKRFGDFTAIDDISLDIFSREFFALLGPSGCGKTTLMRIMLGLLKPTAGRVLIDGRDIHGSGAAVRDSIGSVMQDDNLFAGSLAQNICFFDEQPDMEKILRSALLAAIHEEIIAMPMGYETLVGDMGATLSGGQKQRVLLARALYREPKLLFLDEATSHLDTDRERLVNTAISGLNMTRIIIAHREETLAMADRVIRLYVPNSAACRNAENSAATAGV